MKTLFFLLSAFPLLSISAFSSQPTPTIQRTANANEWSMSITGIAGRTYFIQHSTDLVSWAYFPSVLNGAPIAPFLYNSIQPKHFTRLVFTDMPTLNAANDDFDSDGIPNLFEVQNGSDPLNPASFGGDSDGDGLRDGWELFYFGSLTAQGAGGDADGDLLTNVEEMEVGLNPTVNQDADETGAHQSVYAYDGVGRLDAVSAPSNSEDFTPDEEGNITTAQ